MPNASNGWVEKIARLEERMEHVEEGVSNFRRFTTNVEAFINRSDGAAKERENQHNANKWRLNAIIALATLVAMILLAIGGWIVTINIHRTLSDPHQIFHSYNPEPVVASDAGLPPDYAAR